MSMKKNAICVLRLWHEPQFSRPWLRPNATFKEIGGVKKKKRAFWSIFAMCFVEGQKISEIFAVPPTGRNFYDFRQYVGLRSRTPVNVANISFFSRLKQFAYEYSNRNGIYCCFTVRSRLRTNPATRNSYRLIAIIGRDRLTGYEYYLLVCDKYFAHEKKWKKNAGNDTRGYERCTITWNVTAPARNTPTARRAITGPPFGAAAAVDATVGAAVRRPVGRVGGPPNRRETRSGRRRLRRACALITWRSGRPRCARNGGRQSVDSSTRDRPFRT